MLGCTACKSTSYLEKQSDLSSEDTSEDATDSADTTEETEKKTEIYVQISGAVADPGVYTFPADSRVYELIEAAGGLLPEAYDVSLNQAERLSDGQKIHVYTKEEAAEGLAPTEESSSTSDGKVNINTASTEELTSLKGIGQTRAESIVAYRQEHGAFAAVEDLKAVSGIGDATYQKIADAITVN
nr:helix-hairpin-helix domain-containing protein [Roseburia lenta]